MIGNRTTGPLVHELNELRRQRADLTDHIRITERELGAIPDDRIAPATADDAGLFEVIVGDTHVAMRAWRTGAGEGCPWLALGPDGRLQALTDDEITDLWPHRSGKGA